MKKLNSMLHNEKVQGNLIVGSMVVVIAIIMLITWGK
jgi:hypothetical protein